MKQTITDMDYKMAYLLELLLLDAENKILFAEKENQQ